MTRTNSFQRSLRTISLIILTAVGLGLALPATSQARVMVRIKPARPAVVVKTRPHLVIRPAAGKIVVCKSRPVYKNAVWVPGHWVKKPGRRAVWVEGHWRRI